MLKEIIHKSISGEEESALEIIGKFKPLILKYSRLLGYEDAESDMTIFLLEMLRKIPEKVLCSDGATVSYISKAMKNQFIHISMKNTTKQEVLIGDLSEEQQYALEETLSVPAGDELQDMLELIPNGSLTAREKNVVIDFFYRQWSCAEIAAAVGASRQYIGKVKARAIAKIGRAS